METVDFFPPMVDDPYVFGQIAAANALSDIWAMGARPLFALNLVGFPAKELPLEMLGRILAGGQSKAEEAGIPILGGHSIDDPEPKYGMCVTGLETKHTNAAEVRAIGGTWPRALRGSWPHPRALGARRSVACG